MIPDTGNMEITRENMAICVPLSMSNYSISATFWFLHNNFKQQSFTTAKTPTNPSIIF